MLSLCAFSCTDCWGSLNEQEKRRMLLLRGGLHLTVDMKLRVRIKVTENKSIY